MLLTNVVQPFYCLTLFFMAITTYISLDVALTISSTFEPGNPKDSLHSIALFVFTSIWPGAYVHAFSLTGVRCLTSRAPHQRGIAVFYPDDMGRRRCPARDAPLDILRACRLAFRPRAARVLPLVPPVVQRLEREDRRVLPRDVTGDRVRLCDLSRLAEYHRRYVRLPTACVV